MAITSLPSLTDAEIDKLADFLAKSKGERAMNIEELDGFFAALIAGPELVPPSEYLPQIFGGELSETCEFEGIDEANEILGLIMRYWNGIASTLNTGDIHLPCLLEDDTGFCKGNDWARGFIRATAMRGSAGIDIYDDDERYGWMIPVLILYHEHDEDPKLRPDPVEPETREEIIVGMAGNIVKIYRY